MSMTGNFPLRCILYRGTTDDIGEVVVEDVPCNLLSPPGSGSPGSGAYLLDGYPYRIVVPPTLDVRARDSYGIWGPDTPCDRLEIEGQSRGYQVWAIFDYFPMSNEWYRICCCSLDIPTNTPINTFSTDDEWGGRIPPESRYTPVASPLPPCDLLQE